MKNGLIVQTPHPALTAPNSEVLMNEFNTPELTKILKDMKKALDAQDDGVAIAAPQIGINKRIFLVSEKVFKPEQLPFESLVYINPVITKLSKTKKSMDEGCLSVRWKYGKVERHTQATVTAFNEQGKKFIRGATGLLAHIFQHETDHLEGILFIDKAKDVRDWDPNTQKDEQ